MRLIDITPKTTLYKIINGKIMAVRFKSISVSVQDQRPFANCQSDNLHCNVKMELITADNTTIKTECCTKTDLYFTPQDALSHTDMVQLNITKQDFYTFCKRNGCKPTEYTIPNCPGIQYYRYKLWVYIKDGSTIGAKQVDVAMLDLLNGTITTKWAGKEYTQWYNTKEECLAANTYEVVEFADAEEEQPTDNTADVHIVLVSVIKNK